MKDIQNKLIDSQRLIIRAADIMEEIIVEMANNPCGEIEPEVEPEEPSFNAATFFNEIRKTLFWGSLSQQQVDGFNAIGHYLPLFFPQSDPVRIQKMAYCLATFQWETASTMQPIEEYGGPSTRYAPWYGRGYVQLTWEENYEKQQDKLPRLMTELGISPTVPYEVHDDKNLALHPDTSALISIGGMDGGDFTGKKLSDYIKPGSIDYVEARRIVNGTDKQHEIAEMAEKYESAIINALA